MMALYYEPMEWDSTVTVNEALYQPFSSMDSLRLLTLEPGYLTDPILVRLSIHDADDAPEYDAISYVWGDVGKTTQIFCNGSPTHITFNLLWVLRRIRRSEQPMTLWVDALCINQNDPLERSGQVAKMGRIYARARRVFACMGDDPDGGASGVTSLLGQLLAMIQSIGSKSLVNLNLNEDPRWFSLGVLLRQPWFSRAWVLQEVGLAKDPRVIYGNFEFSYRDVMKIVMWVNNNAPWLIVKANIPMLMIHVHWADWSTRIIGDSASPYEFLDLLDHASLLMCRDPRDHIYAFLGHPLARTSDGRGLMILPDYTKSTWEVFKEVSILLIQQSGLRALSTAEHSESSIKDKFPSWVIRWDIGYVMNNICRHPMQIYRASAKDTTNMQYQIIGDELWVTGVVVDTVRTAWKIEYGTDGTLKFRGHGYNLTLEEIISYLESTSTPCVYGSNRLYNFSLTLNAALDNSLKSGTLAAAFNAYRNWHAQPHLRPIYKDELAHTYWRAICHMCSGRVFIVTEKGYYGLAPWVSAPGDVSCFLFGGLVPFLLRREDAHASRFKLVGEAYIGGLMNSEASHFVNAGQLKAQNLIIC